MKAHLDDLHLYLRIVETGSLRSAAEELGTDPSNVSRRLGGMEERLGVKLIQRSRVRSVPTDAGDRYYRELKRLLDQMTALEDDVAGTANEPYGVLRVSAPIDFGVQYVGPWLHELTAQAANLSVELVVTDQFVDIQAQGIDVAVRIGRLPDSSLVARRLGTMPIVIVASPAYLARQGTPSHPNDLAAHEFVLFSGMVTGATLSLTHAGGETVSVQCPSRFSVNNLGGAARITENGGGMHVGPLWYFAEAIAAGRLAAVLPDWTSPTFPVHALYAPTTYVPAKIRRFVDLAVTRMQATPGILT